jgi:probable HAF family extracellular repeat protein
MRRALLGVAALALLGTAEAAVPQGTPLLIELPLNALAADVGASGFVVVGSFYGGGGLYWMPTSGVQAIGGNAAVAVSLDGKVIVGNTRDERGIENAAIWTGGKEWRRLGSFTPNAQPCDRLLSATFGANDDGRVVVGLGWDGCKVAHAFRWEESTGMVDLGSALPSHSSRANDVSGDGRVVVGWQEDTTGFWQGARWVDGVEELFRGPFGMVGEANAANRDGSLIVGTQCNPYDLAASAWTWTALDGVKCFVVERPRRLPDLPYKAIMAATSEDGRVIGGAFSFGLDSEALVWFDGQAYFLQDYLRDNGVPDAFRGWVNTGFVLGITPDGRVLVGYGAGPAGFQGYMVVLPEMGAR